MRTLVAVVASLWPAVASAQMANYKVNSTGGSRATFESDAPLESVVGVTSKVDGYLRVDPARLAATTSRLEIDAASFKTGNDTRDEHLRGKEWLDTEAHPKIVFELLSVKGIESLSAWRYLRATAAGKLTIRGVTKEVEIPIRVGFFPLTPDLKKMLPRATGDILRVSAKFAVKLSDYGVKVPEILGFKIADAVNVRVDVTSSKE